jgi:serine/threonine protein kinase
MRKELLSEFQQEIIRDEISILSLMDHPHIVKHVESYEDPRYMYIIMESLPDYKELQEIIYARIDDLDAKHG